MSEHVAEDGRFEIRRKLGSGAMGAVYEVFDRERGAAVALKSLRRLDAAAVYRFKREFRALADLVHPNLVQFYELHNAGDSWFFTMELVDGVTFTEYAARAGSRDEAIERVRRAGRQLAAGVAALHAAGKLHRDIKPSNVLVGDDGRVVLCDFGLAIDAAPRPRDATAERTIMGTPAYMAPEQGGHGPIDEAADWYSVGVVLYEALTGKLPFGGGSTTTFDSKQILEPPRPSGVRDTPEDLDELCARLLVPLPGERLAGAEVLARLGVEPREAATAQRVAAPFVGRAAQLALLDEALARAASGAVVARVHAGSGMGKSALVRRFLDRIEARDDVLVVQGRCYEQESVPYKALDAVVDALTRHLMRMSDDDVDAVVPRDAVALARLFPVLRRVEAVALPRAPALEPLDPRESRRRAVIALRELVAALSRRRVLVIAVDDLQWGDVDSARLLGEILRPPDPPRVLFVAAYRSEDVDASPFLRDLLPAHPDAVDVEVTPMSAAETAELVARLADGAPAEGLVAAAGEAAGNPFLITELVRYRRGAGGAAVGVDAVVLQRIEALPAHARRFTEAVAVAGRPVPRAVAVRAAGVSDPGGVLGMLRKAHILRAAGHGDAAIETYHDRIREAVVGSLSPEALRGWHRDLARAYDAAPAPDHEALAFHLLGAGDPERAAAHAVRAAEAAASALAFERAARMYRFALEHARATGRERSALVAALARVLVQLGRGREAAHAFLEAAEEAYVADALDYRRRAAEQLLHSGHVDEGLATIEEVLRALGMRLPGTPRRAIASATMRRVLLRVRGLRYRERDPSQIAAAEIGRIDACWSVAAGLGMVDTIRGLDFQTRHILLALRAGDPSRVSRAIASEGMFVSISGHRGRRRSGELVDLGLELAERSGDPHAIGFAWGAAGLRLYQLGSFTEALAAVERSLAIFETRCTGVRWEQDTAELIKLWCLYYLGRVGELRERLPALLHDARERGDLFAETSLGIGLPNLTYLAAGDSAEARRVCAAAMAQWSHTTYHLQHYWAWVAECNAELYDGDGAAALARARDGYQELRRSMLLRVQGVRIETADVLARCLIAAPGEGAARRRAEARKRARRIGREPLPWARGTGAVLEAAALAAAGDDAAPAALARAADSAEEAGLAVYAAAARHRRALLLGGDEGAAAAEDAAAALRRCGIADPARWTRMLLP